MHSDEKTEFGQKLENDHELREAVEEFGARMRKASASASAAENIVLDPETASFTRFS